MRVHLLVVALLGLARAAFAQAPRELTLDERIDALPPIGCVEHRDARGRPSEAQEIAELRRAVEARALSDEQWRRALSKSGAVRWRRRTVTGEPFLISLRRPAWLDGAELRLTPRLPGASTLRDPIEAYRCLTCDASEHTTFWGWHHGRELAALAPRTRALV
ncbi:MAG: hypothetical protein HZA52_03525, partial [Planctomycetes bacterium]|nr:hypothetical protein [Planctomycetota bacterium]